ncbi:SusD/RagB family nutrient-binding outer membrane lipoprotein [Mucilaginibacter sp. cycad4]|uniref:SusD/RagB family nutrient-binding outer membrane lipoprotein n=1 Tax=Mucilaginibacter sp. cycad4 TaxID=3342096 RepID=UPI002AAB0756|nr:SusD/RagB family nutrient-binding outer membrane lipoprotein [Mucilaginibacter gossypii]WPU99050.1 SusD/RagB family nutrient-binding outer membrane lipoprotein [Mucilaginibacter gossypii]
MIHKSIRLLILFISLSLIITQFGCKKYLDVNYNPRELTDSSATPEVILPPIMNQVALETDDFDNLNMWMGYWSPTLVSPGQPFLTYNNVETSRTPPAEIIYLDQKSERLGQYFYQGISKVMRALTWSMAVDEINNMPYSEAYNSTILFPKYDSGQSIYEDLMNQLTTASSLIKNAEIAKNTNITNADIVFHGDRLKWLQFINTVKLRLLIHQANLPGRESYISQQIAIIKNESSGFLTVDAAENPGYGVNNKVSVYYGLYSSSNTLGGFRGGDVLNGVSSINFAHANVYAMNLLKANDDPRLGFYYSTIDAPIPAGAAEPFPQPGNQNFRGSQLGLVINSVQYPYQNYANLSAVGGSRNTGVTTPFSSGIIKGNDMSNWILTSIESRFLQAEAIYRGWLPGSAEDAYKDAVRETFRWLNVGQNSLITAASDAAFNQWYDLEVSKANPQVSWADAPDKYKLIMFQKYLGLNGIAPLETWTDYRRNGRFPDVPLSVDPSRVSNTLPIRLLYPHGEYQRNPVNVNAQGQINMFTGKIWWMPN